MEIIQTWVMAIPKPSGTVSSTRSKLNCLLSKCICSLYCFILGLELVRVKAACVFFCTTELNFILFL